MRLIGVTRLDQLNPSYVDMTILQRDLPQQLYTENGILKAKLWTHSIGQGRAQNRLGLVDRATIRFD